MAAEDLGILVVDVQPDFMAGGGLAINDGEDVVAPIRELIEGTDAAVVVATQDWHPAGHVSFASSHEHADPMDTIDLYGHEQVLWPDHCVQGTEKARLHPDLPHDRFDAIVRKGTDPRVDSYSAFRDNWNPHGERPATGLAGYFRDRGVGRLLVAGLARDVCVKWTVEDARDAGFEVVLAWDLTRAVDPSSDDDLRRHFEELGVEIHEGVKS